MMPKRTQCSCGRMINPTKHGYTQCNRCRANRQPKRPCATMGCEGVVIKYAHCRKCRESQVKSGLKTQSEINAERTIAQWGKPIRQHPNYRMKRVPLVLCDEPGCDNYIYTGVLCRRHSGKSKWKEAENECAAAGCKSSVGEGDYLCSFHRQSWDLFGSIGRVASVLEARQLECSFDGCERAQSCKGLCNTHYVQMLAGKGLYPIGSRQMGRPVKEGRKPVVNASKVRTYRSSRIDPAKSDIRRDDHLRVESFRDERKGTLCDECEENEGKEVDHTQEIADVGRIALQAPLRWLCRGCHKNKTSAMAKARRRRNREPQIPIDLFAA